METLDPPTGTNGAIFSKVKTFDDIIILDKNIHYKRLKVNEGKENSYLKEYQLLTLREEVVLKRNVVKQLHHLEMGNLHPSAQSTTVVKMRLTRMQWPSNKKRKLDFM